MTTMDANIKRLIRMAMTVYRRTRRYQSRATSTQRRSRAVATSTVPSHSGSRHAAGGEAGQLSKPYPGDYVGRINPSYNPHPDGKADPGEIVWAWVPFQEDYNQGKDRPILLVGRDGEYLLGLMLTSKDRNNERSRDNNYVDIGMGKWDRQGRPSEVRVDRVIRVLEADIRRDGAVLERERFDTVVQALHAR